MKDFLKITGYILFILFLSCEDTTTQKGELVDYIPENTSVVFKISNFENLQTDLNNNGLISEFDKTNPYRFFSEKNTLLKHLKPEGESLLAINKLNDSTSAFTFITRETANLFIADSLKNTSVETLTYDKKTLQRVTINNKIAFTTIKDSVFIASSSQLILQNILDGKSESNVDFKKIYTVDTASDLTAIFKGNAIKTSDTTSVNFASWTALNLEVLPDAITATGVSVARDTVPQLLSIFEGQIPQQNDIAKVIPSEATSVLAFTFNDAILFQKKLKEFRREKSNITPTGIFESANEIGKISFTNSSAIVIKSIDPSLTNDAIARFISEYEIYRDVVINNFSESQLFTNTFAPLLTNIAPKYVFQIEKFYVFTETETVAKQIISSYLNNNVLIKTSYFENTSSQLSNASSLLFYKMNGTINETISGFFNTESAKQINEIDLKKYPIAAIQFSYDRNFAHVNLICKTGGKVKQSNGSVSEKYTIEIDNQILGTPQFFTNHRSKGKDIVVQDVTNTLYLISANGKVLWKEKINEPILGKINEVDLLRNGKKQLAFTTASRFYVLDRNGKDVSPFPIKFKDPITQPLSVFDYDNNRQYRFVITQGKDMLLYDATGKTVKGFTFKKASSKIVLPPQHLRMGNKDYIIVAEENGKLNILSRTGSSRVSVAKKFDFSETLIQEEDNNFVVITKNNTKETISQTGKVSSQKLNVSNSYSFKINGNTKVTLDDNLLRIKGKLIELPFGVYTKPEILQPTKNVYISITETQEKKVYLYDSNGVLLPGFPVYGTSPAILGDVDKNGKLNLLVKGGDKELLLYAL